MAKRSKDMIENYLRHSPVIHDEAWVHPSAQISGEVELAANVSIWPTVVLRGDQGKLYIGECSNVQDGSVVHATGGLSVTKVGRRVTIGHRAIIHGCEIEDDCLIGMGAIVMDNARIGAGSVVGAGAVVLANTVVPPNSLVLGSPAKVVRETKESHTKWIDGSWRTYVRLAREHRSGEPQDTP